MRAAQDHESRRKGFRQMLEAAEEEADREGVVSLASVLAEADQIIQAAENG